MDMLTNDFTPEQYVATMEYEYSGMINALRYLCQEAHADRLDLVGLHLNIAIAELRQYRKTDALPSTK